MRQVAMLSAALIAAVALANPAAARERYVQRPAVVDPDVAVPAAPYYPSGPAYYPGPRVGAFATAPWENSAPPAYYGSPYYGASGYYGY